MGTGMRIVQVAAALAGVALFGWYAYLDPAMPPTRPMLLIGTIASGLGAMFGITFFLTWAMYGKEAARQIEWY